MMDTGNLTLFGSYPQDKVEDEKLLHALNEESHRLKDVLYAVNIARDMGCSKIPLSQEILAIIREYRLPPFNYWNDYVFYGEKFRRVPTDSGVQWYRFQPIKWYILKEQNGVKCLLADTILDAQMFNVFLHKTYETDDGYYINVLGTGRPGNEFEASFLKLWLNSVFFSTAFSKEEQNRILDFTDLDLCNWDEERASIGSNPLYENVYREMFRIPQRYPNKNIHSNRITLLSKYKANKLSLELNRVNPSPYSLSQGFSDSTWMIGAYDYYESTPCRAGVSVEGFCTRGLRTLKDADEVAGVLPMIYISV